jgi:hypothetical protein
MAHFMQKVSLHDWSQYADEASIHNGFQKLENSIYEMYSSSFPWKTIRVSPADKPCITELIKVHIDLRDKAYSERKTLKYLRLRDCVKKLVRAAKKKYISNCIASNKPGGIWKAIKKIVGTPPAASNVPNTSPSDINQSFLATQQAPTIDPHTLLKRIQVYLSSPTFVKDVGKIRSLKMAFTYLESNRSLLIRFHWCSWKWDFNLSDTHLRLHTERS